MWLDPTSAVEARTRASAKHSLARRFRDVRKTTQRLCAPLAVEDYVVQSMPDVSPTKWHLAHTTWFFETFVLAGRSGYRPVNEAYEHLFNSYYNAVGTQFPRPRRGLLSRPTVDEVWSYRRHVDAAMNELLAQSLPRELETVIELGLHHEQQHQELMLTDIKHVLGANPLAPVYASAPAPVASRAAGPVSFQHYAPGLTQCGHDGEGFHFDNETPRHRVFLEPFSLARRLVTCGEYQAFVADDGYRRPELWLSEGWDWVRREGIAAPLYWRGEELFTLAGQRARQRDEPVVHVSYFEADAYARWAGARLPREHELELATSGQAVEGNFMESEAMHPRAAATDGMSQLYGDGWEWTQSPYTAYPGYAPAAGALGEYNGKFMCNQFVLRGGSCATAVGHIRDTYRNFFPAAARWQFSCIRLAKDASS
jgi:ergothioneine biosynthesis protein EgtB